MQEAQPEMQGPGGPLHPSSLRWAIDDKKATENERFVLYVLFVGNQRY